MPVVHLILNLSSSTFLSTSYYSSSYIKGFFLSFVRFQDEIGWAFKMFDVDNSGIIVVEEIRQSVQVLIIRSDPPSTNVNTTFGLFLKAVWKILDGIGDAIDGSVEEITEFIFGKLKSHGKDDVRFKISFFVILIT